MTKYPRHSKARLLEYTDNTAKTAEFLIQKGINLFYRCNGTPALTVANFTIYMTEQDEIKETISYKKNIEVIEEAIKNNFKKIAEKNQFIISRYCQSPPSDENKYTVGELHYQAQEFIKSCNLAADFIDQIFVIKLRMPKSLDNYTESNKPTKKTINDLFNKIMVLEHVYTKNSKESTTESYDQDLKDKPFLLHYAAEQGSLVAVTFALEADYKIYELDSEGNQAFHVAALQGYHNIVRYFIDERDVNPINTNAKKQSGLHLAVIGAAQNNTKDKDRDYQNLIRYLVNECHIDINMPSAWKKTALHLAAGAGDELMVEFLIHELHADTQLTDEEGKTALQLVPMASERCAQILRIAEENQRLEAIQNTLKISHLPEVTHQLVLQEIQNEQLSAQQVNQAMRLLRSAHQTIESNKNQLPKCVRNLAENHQIILDRNYIASKPKLILFYRAFRAYFQQGLLGAMTVTGGYVDSGQDKTDHAIKGIALLAGKNAPGLGFIIGIIEIFAHGANAFVKFQMMQKLTRFAETIEDVLRIAEELARQLTLAKENLIDAIDCGTAPLVQVPEPGSIWERAQRYMQTTEQKVIETHKYLDNFTDNMGKTAVEIKGIEDAKTVFAHMLQCETIPEPDKVVEVLLKLMMGENFVAQSPIQQNNNNNNGATSSATSPKASTQNTSTSSTVDSEKDKQIAALQAQVAALAITQQQHNTQMQLLLAQMQKDQHTVSEVHTSNSQAMLLVQAQQNATSGLPVDFKATLLYALQTTQQLTMQVETLTEKIIEVDSTQKGQQGDIHYLMKTNGNK